MIFIHNLAGGVKYFTSLNALQWISPMHAQGPLLEDKCTKWHIHAWSHSGCANAPVQTIPAKKIKHLIGNGPTVEQSPAETAQNINHVPLYLLRIISATFFYIYIDIYIIYIDIYNTLLAV